MEIHFGITDIQTGTFPIPTVIFKSRKGRQFYVSATDGRITKDTTQASIEGQSLHWNETLDEFALGPNSQLTLRVFEKHSVTSDDLLAIFVISYKTLCSSQNILLLQSTDHGSKKKKSSTKEITVTISKYFIAEFGPTAWPVSHKASNTVKHPAHGSSPSVEDNSRSHFQKIKYNEENDSRLASSIVSGSDSIGKVLDIRDVFLPKKGFLHKWGAVRDRLDMVVRAVATIAEVHPYAKLAWSVISFVPMKISEQIQLDQDVVDLLDAMEQALDLAPDADTLKLRSKLSKNHEKTLVLMMDQISECGRFLQSYAKDVNFWKRFIKNMASDGKKVVVNFQETLMKLRDNFLSEVTVTVEINVFRILAEMESITEVIKGLDIDLKLRELPYGVDTGFDPERGCLPRTRLKFLDAIVDWVNNPGPSPTVLVLFGQAGKGKSSIAHEIARQFHDTGRLTTSYFFVRGKTAQREPYQFFTTLARDLCDMYPAFKISLGNTINDNTKLRYARNYATLFKFLLQKPLNDVRFVGPVLIIIDALDESDGASSDDLASGNTIPFHVFLGQHLSEFPSSFRILVTSRPEPDILKAFTPSSFVRHIQIDDEALADEVEKDILAYMRTKLNEADVDDITLHKLVMKAERLFQWASVACHYIANPPRTLNSGDCIDRVLHLSDGLKTLNPLDSLYMTVLEGFDIDDPEVLTRFHSVMRQILITFEPLSIVSLNTLQHAISDGAKAIQVHDVTKHLASLLSNVSSSNLTLPIEPLHTSFRDFLTDPKRSGKFCVNLDNAHYQLTSATLRTMQKMLHFNVCQLETSYWLNHEVPDLNDRIEKFVPSALSYSCRFWAHHLVQVSELDLSLFNALQVLMKENFLFWLEVLSIMGEMSVASNALLSLEALLGQRHDRVQNEGIGDFGALVKDAVAFVQYFGYPMAQSAPHIYLSALPYTPSTSAIAKLYTPRFPRTVRLVRGRLIQWPPLLLTISVPDKVVCIAFSRDDKYIAAGMVRSIYIWDSSTGMIVSGPIMTGHKFVSSIAFSHDGRYLASGLSDGEIGIWEIKTGRAAVIGGQRSLLRGHTGTISSLSFSEDGQQLVSGSGDCTVRIWDLEKAKAVAEPFLGHNNPVWAVSFLPDNEHILSRSGIRTVRVWNMETGQEVTTPFKVNGTNIATGTVDSVAHYSINFYRDLLRVKSNFAVCSWREAVCAKEKKYKPQGWSKDYWVQAVAFSANGKFVATCSPFHTHVWHATGPLAGNIAGGPYSSTGVMCLAFSTDGQRIVSGSRDGIVRVWSVNTVDEHLSVSAMSHPASVVFLPDGKRIVVGSQYGTFEVLDLLTGRAVVSVKEADEKGRWVKVAVSTNGERIASTAGNVMRFWNATGEVVTGPLNDSDNNRPFRIEAAAFSPDSNDLFVCGTSGGTVRLWNVSTGVPLAESNKICDSKVTCVALSPLTTVSALTTRVAVGTHGKIFIWHTQSGDITGPFTHHKDSVRAIVFAADGRDVTSVADDCTWCVWDSTDGMALRGPVVFSDSQKMNLDESRWSIALTGDGRKVAFIGKHHTILVFEVLCTGDSEAVPQGPLLLAGHANHMNIMAFSRDGQFLASTSNDNTIRVWDLQAAAERKNACINKTSDEPEITEFTDDTFIDNDGWALCINDRGRSPFRMMWVPEIHRAFIHRPSSVFAGNSNETWLDLGRFVHGKDWVKCKEMVDESSHV